MSDQPLNPEEPQKPDAAANDKAPLDPSPEIPAENSAAEPAPAGRPGRRRKSFSLFKKIVPFFSRSVFWIAALALAAYAAREFILKPKQQEAVKKQEEQQAQQKEQQAQEDILPVRVFTVGRFNYEDSLNVLGTIKGGVEFKLSFEIPGLVNSINYREGERYEEGALLVSLKQDDILLRLKKSQAEKNKAETALALAEEDLKNKESLNKLGAIPKSTLDKTELEVESAEYDLEASMMEVRLNEAILEKSNLYAPSDGMIGELYIEEGEAVTPNTLMGSHISTDVVFAEFGVVERDVGKLALGQRARVYVDAYPDKTFEGIIENIAPIVSGNSRTSTGRIRLENPDGLLLPGMFSRVKILLYSKRNALVIPTDSMQGTEEEPFVWLINKRDNKAEKRGIKVGYKRTDYCQIDAGLEEEEWVAVSGLEKIQEGTEVKVVEQQKVE